MDLLNDYLIKGNGAQEELTLPPMLGLPAWSDDTRPTIPTIANLFDELGLERPSARRAAFDVRAPYQQELGYKRQEGTGAANWSQGPNHPFRRAFRRRLDKDEEEKMIDSIMNKCKTILMGEGNGVHGIGIDHQGVGSSRVPSGSSLGPPVAVQIPHADRETQTTTTTLGVAPPKPVTTEAEEDTEAILEYRGTKRAREDDDKELTANEIDELEKSVRRRRLDGADN
ncbi:hypothetical protein BDN72DRAFT_862996 [Pluteus cervinus]|uniref:Uncharacterized protein n=1 Tax=Pluteus cervinus TaxID=181527 RepID=A0ACD3A9D3_9AGAR|nr:hypothetical protein BDN72DRAFT_862996 [Pluteus cervinus]